MNETWTDWMIQCDFMQDITSFSALDWLYSIPEFIPYGGPYHASSKTGKVQVSRSRFSRIRSLGRARGDIYISIADSYTNLTCVSLTSSKTKKMTGSDNTYQKRPRIF